MIHIWLPSPTAAFRVWQQTTQEWLEVASWQEIGTLVTLQQGSKSKLPPTCLYFPSLYLLKIQPNLPANQLKALGEAGRRYLFEDISIGTVDDIEVKLATAVSPHSLPTLYGLHTADREQWLMAASLAGIEVVALLPDFLLLPIGIIPPQPLADEQKTASLADNPTALADNTLPQAQAALFYQDSQTQLLRLVQPVTATPDGFAVTHLPLTLAQLPTVRDVWVMGNGTFDPKHYANVLSVNFHLPAVTSDSLQPLPLADNQIARQFFNFIAKKNNSTATPYARVVGWVFLAAIVSAFLVEGLRWFYYQKALTQTQAATARQYNQWFPNEKLQPRMSLELQMQAKLIPATTTKNDIMATLANVAPVLQQYQITAKNLNFQGKSLDLQLLAKDSDTFNKAVTQLTQQGIQAKLSSVSNAPLAMTTVGNSTSNPSVTSAVNLPNTSQSISQNASQPNSQTNQNNPASTQTTTVSMPNATAELHIDLQ